MESIQRQAVGEEAIEAFSGEIQKLRMFQSVMDISEMGRKK